MLLILCMGTLHPWEARREKNGPRSSGLPSSLLPLPRRLTRSVCSAHPSTPRYAPHPLKTEYVITNTIVHPGEVSRLRVVPQAPQCVVTHSSESEKVYLWNLDKQANHGPESHEQPQQPDLILEGHQDMGSDTFYYALAVDKGKEPLVISGGSDKKVLMWSLEDYVTSLSGSGGDKDAAMDTGTAQTLQPRAEYKGHTVSLMSV